MVEGEGSSNTLSIIKEERRGMGLAGQTNSICKLLVLMMLLILIITANAVEMVEHDTAPEVEEEEKETVVEEPHMKKESEEVKKEKEKEGVKGETKSEENENASSATDESQQQSYAGMSSFLSGIASMVQTTVRANF